MPDSCEDSPFCIACGLDSSMLIKIWEAIDKNNTTLPVFSDKEMRAKVQVQGAFSIYPSVASFSRLLELLCLLRTVDGAMERPKRERKEGSKRALTVFLKRST